MLSRCFLVRYLALFVLMLSVIANCPNAGAKAATSTASARHEQVPGGHRIFAVPLLQSGKPAWASVYDDTGRPAPGICLYVNGRCYLTDDFGQAAFDTPEGHTVLSLSEDGSTDPAALRYTPTEEGLLCCESEASAAFDRLGALLTAQGTSPSIAYAPALLEIHQPFIIVGKNFTGTPGTDRVFVDGFTADLFSGSPVCVLATAPRRLTIGPLRELFMVAGAESSNTVEVDICRVDFTVSDEAPPEGVRDARVRIIGTNLPALVEVRNRHPDQCIFFFAEKRLSNVASFMSPGGLQNHIPLKVKAPSGLKPDAELHLVADAPWSPDDQSYFANTKLRSLIANLNRAQIVRLKRRMISLESKLSREQEQRDLLIQNEPSATARIESLSAQLRSLSLRQRRMTGMINARRALLESLGGTDEEYRQAMDDAAGGAYISLENWLKPAELVAAAPILASGEAPPEPEERSAPDSDGKSETASEQRLQKAEAAVMEAFARGWKRFPTKPAPTRSGFARPPEPYTPDLSELGPLERQQLQQTLEAAKKLAKPARQQSGKQRR